MGDFMSRLKSAMEFMSCNVSNEIEVKTRTTYADDMTVGMQFVDNGVAYTVTDKKVNNGTICLYATTNSNKADGWFTRDSYNVIIG